MLMITLDLLITAYQGSLLMHVIRRQFHQRTHSFLYEVASVFAFVIFFSTIQYLNFPVPEILVVFIPLLYIKATTQERLSVCALWAILDIFLLLGTLTLISGLFDLQIDINGNVLEGSNETRIIYYFTGTTAVTVVLNIAASLSKASNVISQIETILFILTLLFSFIINETFFYARLSGNEHTSLLIGSACSFFVMILTMLLYDRLTETTRKKRQMELTAQTTQLVSEHQEELKSIYTYMLAEQHDLRHRIAAAEEILTNTSIGLEQRNEVLALLSYPDPPRLCITGCIAADAIIKAKLTVMETAGISFELVDCPLPPLPFPEQSFCMLLGNLLDNAIEGVMRLPETSESRHIRLSISKLWSMLFISCVNDADPKALSNMARTFYPVRNIPSATVLAS